MKVERSVRVAAPPKRLYDVIMDPARLEDWVTIHHHLESAPPPPLKKGSELTQCLRLGGKKFNVHWTVVENEPCERVTWEGRGPVASRARVEYASRPTATARTSSTSTSTNFPEALWAGSPVRRFRE